MAIRRITTASSRHSSQVDLAEQGRYRMTWARHASPPPATRLTRDKAAEQDHDALQNARAARTVAGHATDTLDCCQLLEMLGLDATDGKRR